MGLIQSDIESIVQEELKAISPYVNSHGGNIELVAIHDGIVTLALKGTCSTCPLSFYTVSMGIQTRLKHKIPSLKEVKIEQ
jgi:Fe-S cluster biogenesis protein NfuA